MGMKRYLRRLFAANNGETLVETLVSVLIVSAVFLMLSTAIVTAANINARAKGIDSAFNDEKAEPAVNQSQYALEVKSVGTDPAIDADKYTVYTENGYVYYKYKSKPQNGGADGAQSGSDDDSDN